MTTTDLFHRIGIEKERKFGKQIISALCYFKSRTNNSVIGLTATGQSFLVSCLWIQDKLLLEKL